MKEFQTNVMWDLNLIDAFCVNSQSAPLSFQGLVYQARYIKAGIPVNNNGKYVAGAFIQNLADGHWYKNNGTTAACNFVQII